MAQLVVLRQPIEVLFQSQYGQDSRQHAEAGREVAPLEAGQRASRDIHAGSQIRQRHAAPTAREAKALAKRLSATLSLREKRT